MKKYEAVIEYIYRCVQTGIFKEGDFLPSIRTLVQQIGVSSTSVEKAYSQLEAMGIIESTARKGFCLIDGSKVPTVDAKPLPPVPVPSIVLNYMYRSNKAYDDMVPFGSMSPSSTYFPNEELGKCLSRISRRFPNETNISGFSRNSLRSIYPVEAETAQYIFRIHGLSIHGDEICQTNGATEAILVALRALTRAGDVVALESPFFQGAYIAIGRLHLKPLEIPATFPHGLDLDRLEAELKNGVPIRCLIVTPNFQNPTGALMPTENRDRLIDLSEKYGFVIIEDDTLGALRGPARLQTLKERRPDDVAYVSSYSKTLAPGYRIGWVAGGRYSFNMQALHMLESFEDSLIGHLAVTEYVKSGKYVAQIERLRTAYCENAGKMMRLLKEHFPEGTHVTEPKGGQYLWVTLPGGMSAEALYHKALDIGALLAPGTLFGETVRHESNLRFCYAMPITETVAERIRQIGVIACSS